MMAMALSMSMPSVSNLNDRRNICYNPYHVQFHIKWLEFVISFSNSTCIVENLKCSFCFRYIAKSMINWCSYFRFWRCWGLIGGCFNQCTQSDFCILNEFVITALIWNYSKCIRINCLSKQTCLKHAHRTLVRFPNPHTVGTYMTPPWSFWYARRTIWLSCRKSFSPKRKPWICKVSSWPWSTYRSTCAVQSLKGIRYKSMWAQ